jgi:hypothetical protein
MSDVNSYQDIQTLFQRQEQEQRAAQQTHQLEVNAIVDAGRERHGSDRFDEMSATVAEKLGNRTAEFMSAARQFDSPVELIERLADDPRELERLAKLPTARMLVEIARIESRLAPSSHAVTTTDPVWKRKSIGFKEVDWNGPLQDRLSDKEYDKIFQKRQEERAARRR